MSSTQLQKPSKELLTSAILAATTYIKPNESLNYKGLRLALEKAHPHWKLSERRVTKYAKKMKKMQVKGSLPEAESFDVDDEGSVSSSCYQSEGSSFLEAPKTTVSSNASNKTKSTFKFNKSLKKTLSLKVGKEDKATNSKVVPSSSSAEVDAPAAQAPNEAKATNILPQLEDEFLSDSENDDILSSTKTSPTASSPSSVPSFDDHDAPALKIINDESKDESPEQLLGYLEDPAEDEGREENMALIGENLLSEDDFASDERVAAEENDTLEKQTDRSFYSDDNDGKKEGAVCEGCVIL